MHFLIVQMKGRLSSWNNYCYFLKFRKCLLLLTLCQQSVLQSLMKLCNIFSVPWEERAVKIAYLYFFSWRQKIIIHHQLKALSSRCATAVFEQQHLCKWGESSPSIWSLLLLLILSTSVPFSNMSVCLYWEQNEVFSHK